MAVLDQSNYRNFGDVTFEFFESEFRRVNSPMLSKAREMYDALKAKPGSPGMTRLALAHMWRECQYETDRDVLRTTDHNPFNMKAWVNNRWADDGLFRNGRQSIPVSAWADYQSPESMGAIQVVPTGLTGDAPYLVFDSYVSAAVQWRRRVIDDPRYKGGVYTRVDTLQDYIETYAPVKDYHVNTGVNNATYYPNMVDLLTRFGNYMAGTGTGAPPVATHPVGVILIAGHNSVGDGGNPTERALTPALAKAYLAAYKAEGIPATWINPTLYAGGLDGLALATARAIRDMDADLVLALDLHYNGSSSGVHVIVAHNRSQSGGMLASGYVQGRDPGDVTENNPLDAKFATALAKAIVAKNPGMSLWDADGIMLENQTGVGLPISRGGKNSRLAMMAASAPYREKAIRVTVEHGGTNDAKRENFNERCAAAAVEVTKKLLGDRIGGEPNPDPTVPVPPTGDTGKPSLPVFLFGGADGYAFDPNGSVSKLWLSEGKVSGMFPRLIDVEVREAGKYFVFGDGSVIFAPTGAAPRVATVEDLIGK